MRETDPTQSQNAENEPLEFSALDLASYLFQLSDEMAALADAMGFSKVAAALELARSLCAEELAAAAARQSRSGNAAPEEAA